uniref:Uncharacterized protein n=1 Tax=Anguilla anguilla TaxID=7936 RepID=A0A0E9T2L6_ANGAN
MFQMGSQFTQDACYIPDRGADPLKMYNIHITSAWCSASAHFLELRCHPNSNHTWFPM